MIIRIKYGFKFDRFLYGWKGGELYRLPQVVDNKSYPLLKINRVKVGNGYGYNIERKKKSEKQLKGLTIFINFEYEEIKDKDMPF